MPARKKRIAVIGGGFAGFCSIVMLKEEEMEPVCFEQTDNPGGTWFYREESIDGLGSLMANTVLNTSKEMSAISNFPPRKEFHNYMRPHEMYQYFTEYHNQYDCLKHVKFNMIVTSVKRCEDYDESGRWEVTAKNTVTGQELTDVYDGVMVCVGHMNRPVIPKYPGQESFKGKIIHTHSFKEVNEFKEQNILVVGIGSSAVDAAVAVSDVAKQVYLSTRSGAYILSRVGPGGYPMDYVLLRRFLNSSLDILPVTFCSWFIEKLYIDSKFDHKLYNVPPKYRFLSKDPVVNDEIAFKLLCGSVIQKRDISHFTETGVIFEGSNEEVQIDAVIMGTGYTWKFPFLEDGIVTQETNGRINLYKAMYPPHLKHPTLAIIGFVKSFGSMFPINEMQCRWAAHIFAEKGHLPPVSKMLKDIKRKHRKNVKRYAPSDKMTLRVDWMQYMDDIASELGVKPSLLQLCFTDFRLFWKLYWGPCVPYQYRLRGPHLWVGARDAIMTCKKRIVYPLKPDAKNKTK